MDPRWWLVLGAIFAGLAVGAGAYGAHGIKPQVDKGLIVQKRLDDFDTATRNQSAHAVGLMLVGLLGLARRPTWPLHFAGAALLLGIVLFCGGLYGYAVFDRHEFVAVVPVGGIAFMVGWLALAIAGWRATTRP